MTETAPQAAPTSMAEKVVPAVSLAVTATLVSAVVGTYLVGRSASPNHVTVGAVELAASPAEVLDLLQDMTRRPDWRPDVTQIARKSDPTDDREVWRELDDEDDRFDFEVTGRPHDGVVLRTDAPEQIGYEATWTFQVAPGKSGGSRVTVTEEGFIDNPLFRGLFWLRDGPEQTVRDELTWLGLAVDGASPTIDELTVEER